MKPTHAATPILLVLSLALSLNPASSAVADTGSSTAAQATDPPLRRLMEQNDQFAYKIDVPYSDVVGNQSLVELMPSSAQQEFLALDTSLEEHTKVIDEACNLLLKITERNTRVVTLPDENTPEGRDELKAYPDAIRPLLRVPRAFFRLCISDAHRFAANDTEDPYRCMLRLEALFALTSLEEPGNDSTDHLVQGVLLRDAIHTTRETFLRRRSHRDNFRDAALLDRLIAISARYPADDPTGFAEATRHDPDLDLQNPFADPEGKLRATIDRATRNCAAALAGFRAELGVLAGE